MTQRISQLALNKRLSASNLSKVGGVSLKGGGVQRNAGLKRTLLGMGVGKTRRGFSDNLRRAGVAGNQQNKREKILDLAFGSKIMAEAGKAVSRTDTPVSKSEMEKIVRRNLVRNKESGNLTKKLSETQYGGGRVQVVSVQTKDSSLNLGGRTGMEGQKGQASDLGVGVGRSTDFAQKSGGTRPAEKPMPEAPLKGSRPLGL